MDYSHEGVRAHRLAIFTELAENYDIDGLELDFMRSCRYFASDEAEAKQDVLTKFVGQIRAMLDRVAQQRGREKFILGVRMPPSYKIGELKIRELRARAEMSLGSDFDIRDFHDEILAHGSVRLSVLEAAVDRWIAAQKK